MNNFNFTKRLTENKNQILNYFNTKPFYFNFTNSKGYVGKRKTGTRADWAGAHFTVTYFSGSEGFRQYEAPKSYYITFNTLAVDNILSFSIRKDLIDHWVHNQDSYKFLNLTYILVASKLDNRFYEIHLPKLLETISRHYKSDNTGKVRILNTKMNFVDYTIQLDIKDLVCNEAVMNDTEYKPLSDDAFSADWYKPEYIANFTYSKYRQSTTVKMFLYNKLDGSFVRSGSFRSIKELYDNIKTTYKKSYKTLQRDAITEKVIDFGAKYFLVVTTDIKKDQYDFDIVEVIIRTAKNPLFDKTKPESKDNPKKLTVEFEWQIDDNGQVCNFNDYVRQLETMTIDDDMENYIEEIAEIDKEHATAMKIDYDVRSAFDDTEATQGDIAAAINELKSSCKIDTSDLYQSRKEEKGLFDDEEIVEYTFS